MEAEAHMTRLTTLNTWDIAVEERRGVRKGIISPRGNSQAVERLKLTEPWSLDSNFRRAKATKEA